MWKVKLTVRIAAFNIALPEPFSFTQLEKWPQWISFGGKFHSDQLNISNQPEDILLSFQLTDKEAKKCTMVLEKFKRYFVKCRNVNYEISKFNWNVQESHETVNAFTTALCWLVEIYKYGQLKLKKWLRSWSFVRICDNAVAEI